MKLTLHGGQRKGAGRPKSGRKTYVLRMRPRSMEALRRKADGRPPGEAIERMADEHGW